jgi:UDP-N-acetylglucosamine acyltransferase
VFWTSRKSAALSFRYENVSIHPSSEVGSDVEIGPFSVVGPNCRVGDGCRLHNNVTLVANTTLGKDNEVYPSAVLGGEPQDRKFAGEESWLVIGDGNKIRECVTMHRGTQLGGEVTRVGSRNLLMSGCHVAHDCIVEDDVTLSNNVLLGGHVVVERHAGVGGMAAVHHFVRIGEHSFVGGMSRISKDVPPFMLVEGNPARVWAINKVGLNRKGFSPEVIEALKQAHRLLFRGELPRAEARARVEVDWGGVDEVRRLLRFLEWTERGRQGRAGQPVCGLEGRGVEL